VKFTNHLINGDIFNPNDFIVDGRLHKISTLMVVLFSTVLLFSLISLLPIAIYCDTYRVTAHTINKSLNKKK